MIICKFGGTSVQDADAILRLRDIVGGRIDERPLVVVSALAKVTDALFEVGRLAVRGNLAKAESGLNELISRHRKVASGLPDADRAVRWIVTDGEALCRLLAQVTASSCTQRLFDAVASRGELWSSQLVATALESSGIAAEWVDIRPVMVTDDRFTRAAPDVPRFDLRARGQFEPLLAANRVPVTQGFIGATQDGVPTTLGRGGSDFSASLLGAALHAARVEIWTDVDGLMTADPRIVPSARTLSMASYDEAAELAAFGAKVLHPATQFALARAGIPIVILNSSRPALPGTTIAPSSEVLHVGDSPVRSISWKKGITVINIRAPRMLGAHGFLLSLFEVFDRHEVAVDVLASTEVSVSLTIDDCSRLDAVVRELSPLGEVTVDEGRAIVIVVGVGMRHTPGVAARVFSAVRPANVEIISQGGSEINITFVIKEEDGPDTVRRLHQEFFGTC